MGIIGGGVTGVLLVLAVKTGFVLAFNSGSSIEMRSPAAIIIAFCGGLATYRVRSLFATAVEKFAQGPPQAPPPPAALPKSGNARVNQATEPTPLS
jgi:hypothetical protein